MTSCDYDFRLGSWKQCPKVVPIMTSKWPVLGWMSCPPWRHVDRKLPSCCVLILELNCHHIVSNVRYLLPNDGFTWIVHEFHQKMLGFKSIIPDPTVYSILLGFVSINDFHQLTPHEAMQRCRRAGSATSQRWPNQKAPGADSEELHPIENHLWLLEILLLKWKL